MRNRLTVLALLAVAAAGIAAQQQFTLLATIIDPETNQPPATLTPGDVRVLEEGLPAKVLKVEAVTRTVKAQLLVDTGVGIGNNLSELRGGVRRLVEALPQDVEVTLVTTAPQGRIVVRSTRNREELLKGVDRLTLDQSAGRFTESLIDAVDRANKEKDIYSVIVAAATTSGDADIRTEHAKELLTKLQGRPITVHVLLYSDGRSASAGEVQINVAEQVTRRTNGRYEFINSMNRYMTMLPQFGAELAKELTGNTKQFRITVQRPDGKTGIVGKSSMSAGNRIISRVLVE